MASKRIPAGAALFAVGVTVFFAAFLVYPVFYVFDRAFAPGATAVMRPGEPPPVAQSRFSLEYFRLMIQSDVERECLWNSAALGLVTVLGTSLLCFPLALLNVRYRFWGKGLMTGLVLAPMIMPPFVGAIGMQRVLSREGCLNLILAHAYGWVCGLFGADASGFDGIDFLGAGGFWAVAVMQVLHLYPIMYLNVVSALANVDPSLEDAARNLGDRGLRLFRKITLPLLLPGYFAGAILVFVWAFTDLGTPLVFGFRRVIAVRVFDRLSDISENPMGYASVVVMVVVSALAFLAARALTGRRAYAMTSKGSAGSSERPLGWVGTCVAFGVVSCFLLAALAPHAAVLLASAADEWQGSVAPSSWTLDGYRAVFSKDVLLLSVRNSLFLSLSSTLVDAILGVGLAVILVRLRRPALAFLDALAMTPLALPGLVLAFGYVACYGDTPGLNPKVNPIPLLIIAYSVRRLPFMLRSVAAGLQQTSEAMEEASLNLGATPGQTLSRITIPLVLANVVAGAILTFSFAMLEVSDSLVLAANPRFYPITKAIYTASKELGQVGLRNSSAMGVLAMFLLAGALVAAGALLGKRMGEIFRAG